jgi:hypothetical protein
MFGWPVRADWLNHAASPVARLAGGNSSCDTAITLQGVYGERSGKREYYIVAHNIMTKISIGEYIAHMIMYSFNVHAGRSESPRSSS